MILLAKAKSKLHQTGPDQIAISLTVMSVFKVTPCGQREGFYSTEIGVSERGKATLIDLVLGYRRILKGTLKYVVGRRPELCFTHPVYVIISGIPPICLSLNSLKPEIHIHDVYKVRSPLHRQTCQCCLGKQSLFNVRTIRNTEIHCVGK
jgi:hypothetical protein